MILKQFKLIRIIFVLMILCLLNTFWPRPNKNEIDNMLLSQELSLVKKSNIMIKHYKDNNNINNEKAYATFIASSSFFPAFQVFLYSFYKNVVSNSSSSDRINTLIIGAGQKNMAIVNAAKIELAKYPDINYEIHILPALQSIGLEKPRWAVNWSKLFLWSILDFKILFYVDLDVIFLQNVNDVFNYPFENFLGTSDSGRYNRPDSKRINGGVFLMNPSLEILRSMLISRRLNISQYETEQVEQGFINFYFKSKCCLPLNFNVQKTSQRYWEQYWMLESTKILHMVGEKPWRSWSHATVRDSFITNKYKFVGKLRKADSWDADIYQESHNLWKYYYFKARHYNLNKLCLCVGHNGLKPVLNLSDKHYASLLNYRYLQLDSSIESKNDFVMQVLMSDKIRNQLGPIVTIFLASEMIESDFIGITNIWTEADTIDWTKVDFHEKKVYFWYATHVKNYYDYQELHHPGIIKVMQEIVGSLPHLAPGHFITMNNIICSKEILKNISRDMINMIRSYLRKYGYNKCPFRNGGENCLLHFAETYMNIWIAMQKITTIYSVDNNILSSQFDEGDEVFEDNNEYFSF